MKLNLKVGERVRNIRVGSTRAGWQGAVIVVTEEEYEVRWDCGEKQAYLRRFSHKNLERTHVASKCTCVHDELCDRCARQVSKALKFMERYGAGHKTLAEAAWNVLTIERSNGRKVLKRERRNVITGQTQAEMQAQYGPAKGGIIFNTRTLGRSTGQAFRILGEAMCNPGIAIRYEDVDHAISEGTSNRVVLNRHFEQVLRDTIGERKGFTLERGHVTFNPIVTEETYVTQ
ncbi:hypothetical protein GRN51_370 [Salmonella phage GRNsp51]|uniref:Uncharacterized protein n=1 Tax=Salmonella phage GRNsp51 TaxID=2948587 RepID=A0A9E7INJ3_9CAUD|nr:hypothetical protein GRN51_370 [Salmonella phage GRNsp51]